MLSYPDISNLSDDLAAAVVRLVRLINQLRTRDPDLDRIALSVETDVDLRAAYIVIRHADGASDGFQIMLSPWDARQLLEERG